MDVTLTDSIKVSIESNDKKDGWDIAKIISVAAVAPTVALVGYLLSADVKVQEVEVKYVELAVGILKEPKDKTEPSVRQWAIDIVNEYSGVEMSEMTKNALLEKPFIYEKPALETDLYLSDNVLGSDKSIRITVVNHGKSDVIVDKVTISDGQAAKCKFEIKPTQNISAEASYFIDVVSLTKISECLGVDSSKVYGASTKPTMDAGAFGDKLKNYTVYNQPFFITMYYSNVFAKTESTFGASLHILE